MRGLNVVRREKNYDVRRKLDLRMDGRRPKETTKEWGRWMDCIGEVTKETRRTVGAEDSTPTEAHKLEKNWKGRIKRYWKSFRCNKLTRFIVKSIIYCTPLLQSKYWFVKINFIYTFFVKFYNYCYQFLFDSLSRNDSPDTIARCDMLRS